MVVNDISQKQMEIFKSMLSETEKQRTKINLESFPTELKFQENSFDGILVSRLFHFFDGDTVIIALRKIYSWLKPGGKLFIICDSDKLGLTKFLPKDFKEKVKIPWGGYANNLHELVGDKYRDSLPEIMHLFSPEVLKTVLEDINFNIEKIDYISRIGIYGEKGDRPILDGRESIGAIATKGSM